MVAFVSTALCADRVVAAAPTLRTLDAVGMARHMTGRLMISFRRVVAAAPLHQVRRQLVAAAEPPVRVAVQTSAPAHDPAPLHRYRLPPPAVC
jgi:hypothetical protein